MISLLKSSIALTLLIFTNGTLTAQNRNANVIKGSGNLVTRTVTTQDYSSIYVSGSMDVYLEKGSEGKIIVTAEDNVQDRILIESNGETLTISMKKNTSLRNTKKIKITVPFEDISEISLNGSADIEGKSTVDSNSLALKLNGSGDIDLSVETTNIKAQINGSGDIDLDGKASEIEVKIIGSGDFDAEELIAENVEVSIAGSGNASVYASSSLKSRIQGSGSVLYGGNPTTNDSKVMGSGSVKPL